MAEKYAIIKTIINISFFIRRILPMQPAVKNKRSYCNYEEYHSL